MPTQRLHRSTSLSPPTSTTDLQNAVALSTARNAGYVYITPNGEPNPYGALPPTTYFDNEIQFVASATT